MRQVQPGATREAWGEDSDDEDEKKAAAPAEAPKEQKQSGQFTAKGGGGLQEPLLEDP